MSQPLGIGLLGEQFTVTACDAGFRNGVDARFKAQLEAVAASLQQVQPFPLPEDDYVRSMAAIERVQAAMDQGR